MDEAPNRFQSMLIRVLAYDITVKYLEGQQILISDTLSRTQLPVNGNDISKMFEKENAVSSLQCSAVSLILFDRSLRKIDPYNV